MISRVENDAKNPDQKRGAEEFNIPEDVKRSGNKSFMILRLKDKDNANGTVMTSSLKEITLEKDKDTETGSHNESIITFARLVGIKDFNSDYFDIRDSLLSNWIWSNSVPS